MAAALVADYGIAVYAINGEDRTTATTGTSSAAVDHRPHITMDDGADVVGVLHYERIRTCWATSGRHRGDDDRRHPAAGDGARRARSAFPIVAVNEANTKHFFDNRYGTGQSTIDGHPARHQHPARRARRSSCAATAGAAAGWPTGPAGMGAHVIVVEVDPLRALAGRHGRLPGRCRSPRRRRAGDIFVTATGNKHVLRRRALRGDEGRRRSSPTPATSTSRSTSRRCASSPARRRGARPLVEHFDMADGRGALPARRGPARQPGRRRGASRPSVMDMSFANQALVGRVRGQEPRRARDAGLRRAAARSTTRSRGSSSRAWASRSTR